MSDPGNIVSAAIARHRASVEASLSTAAALAAEREARISAAVVVPPGFTTTAAQTETERTS